MKQIALLFFVVSLLLTKVALAETGNEKEAVKQVQFNYGILQTVKDAEVYLYILNEIKNGHNQNVEIFLEYQLDEIAVGLSHKMSICNKAQRISSQSALQKIKIYRQKHQRNFKDKSNPRSVSHYLMDENPDIPKEADQVLKKIAIKK